MHWDLRNLDVQHRSEECNRFNHANDYVNLIVFYTIPYSLCFQGLSKKALDFLFI